MKNLFPIAVAAVIITSLSMYSQASENSKTLTPVTIAEYGEYLLYTSLYVAEANDYFEEEGLEVSIVPAGGDEKVFAALLSGDAQFGVSDPTFVAISGQRGQPGRVIASILQNVPAWGVTKNPKIQKISNPTELAGLTVATYPAPSTSYTLQKRMFLKGNLQPNIRELAYGSILPALDAGHFDIALENEPNVSLALKNGARRVYSLTDYYPEFAFTGLMALPDYLNNNPETAQKVVNAFHKAMLFMHSDPSGTIEILAQRFPEYSKDVIASAIHRSLTAGTFPKSPILKINAWDQAIQVRTEVGDLSRPASFHDYVDNRFAKRAASK